MLSVDVDNRSGIVVDEAGAVELAGKVLRGEGIDAGELGIAFVGEDEMRELKRTHLGVDEVTDVLSFPIDGDAAAPAGPRELGDVVICPEHTVELREAVVHGVLHLLGMDHEVDEGEMLVLQRELLSW